MINFAVFLYLFNIFLILDSSLFSVFSMQSIYFSFWFTQLELWNILLGMLLCTLELKKTNSDFLGDGNRKEASLGQGQKGIAVPLLRKKSQMT